MIEDRERETFVKSSERRDRNLQAGRVFKSAGLLKFQQCTYSSDIYNTT